MLSSVKLQVLNPATTTTRFILPKNQINKSSSIFFSQNRVSFPPSNTSLLLKLHQFSSLSISIQSKSSSSLAAISPSLFTSSVGSPSSTPPLQFSISNRQLFILNAIACVCFSDKLLYSNRQQFLRAGCFSLRYQPFSSAFKRAAESLEKLLDDTREELPDTMAAVRLSGMEISDLTMELSDLGQDITQGVRRSTRVVRVAEDKLRSLTNIKPTALVQEQASPETKEMEPMLARSARGMREGIVKGRALLQMFFSISQFSRMALSYLTARGKKP